MNAVWTVPQGTISTRRPYVTHWAKTSRFRTFLKFHFIAFLFSTVIKEWTTKVSAFYDWRYSWNSTKYSNYMKNKLQMLK